MKTEVILTSNIVGLGAESDQVKVAAGYARNFLFPQRLAIPLTHANKRRIEALKQRRAEREAHEFNTMSELAKGVGKLICIIKVKTGEDGKMFGTVTSGMIADELKHQFDISLDKRKIHTEHPIRTLGDHDVDLRLHQEVNATLKVRVESTTPLPTPVEAPAAPAEGKQGEKTEKRGRARHGEAEGEHKEAKAETAEKKPRAPRTERAPRAEKAHKTEKTHKEEKEPKAEKHPKPKKAEKAE
jgi:large subunit ribosomal protein L9